MQKTKSSLLTLAFFSLGVAIGGAVMFIMDPAEGRSRRARARDKAVKMKNEMFSYSAKQAKHLRNQGKGLLHKAGVDRVLH